MKKTPHPKIVSREKWLAARKKLLGDEKKITKQHDKVTPKAEAADGEHRQGVCI
jgi:predicted dithiol-disulfide oxidoreductase (DUF899 family)